MEIDYITSFFKLIFLPLHLCLLPIPGEFMKTHGNELSDCIALHIPCTRATWKTKLIWSENGGEAWFCRGWPEFVKFYSISIGYFLMFRYKGHSQFDVFIMDMSACEIEYPVVPVKAGPADPCRASLKRVKTEIVNCSEAPVAGCSSKKAKIAAAPKKVYGHRRDLTSAEMKVVEAYPTDGPSFVVKVAPSHVKSKYRMTIPMKFIKEHMKEKKTIFIDLINEKRRKTWTVKYEVKRKGSSGQRQRHLTEGWRDFAKDNELRVGDICIWELIKERGKKMFKVGILPRAGKIYHGKNCSMVNSEDDNGSEDDSD